MTNKVMNLSIVIPVFNEEKTILELLNRVNILKDLCNLEIVVINDGSTDNTKDIIENLLGKIYTYKTNKFFTDIGTLKEYEKANNFKSN